MTKKRRISFSEYDVAHLYELALDNFCVSEKEGVCHICLDLKKRLEKFVGKKEIKHIQRQIKKYPYKKRN